MCWSICWINGVTFGGKNIVWTTTIASVTCLGCPESRQQSELPLVEDVEYKKFRDIWNKWRFEPVLKYDPSHPLWMLIAIKKILVFKGDSFEVSWSNWSVDHQRCDPESSCSISTHEQCHAIFLNLISSSSRLFRMAMNAWWQIKKIGFFRVKLRSILDLGASSLDQIFNVDETPFYYRQMYSHIPRSSRYMRYTLVGI